MKKRNLVKTGLALAAAMVVMTGCGNSTTETTSAETTAEETTARETKSAEELNDEASITLAEYKGLARTIEKKEITDADVEEELEYLTSMYPAEVTGRPAKLGDTANIDYVGYDGDEAFDGGTANGYDLKLGSGNFIDGFEDGIVGMKIGEERDLNLKFPEEYHSEELAGKEVVFHVTLNSLSNADETEVDDALAKRVLSDEAATLEQLRTNVYEDLKIEAESNYYLNAGAELLTYLLDHSEITPDPDAIEEKRYSMEQSYKTQAEMYGFEYEAFLSYFFGMEPADLETYASDIVKQEMIIDEIVRLENLEATDEQMNMVAKMNGFDDAAEMIEMYGEDSCERVFTIASANYYLLDNSVLTEE